MLTDSLSHFSIIMKRNSMTTATYRRKLLMGLTVSERVCDHHGEEHGSREAGMAQAVGENLYLFYKHKAKSVSLLVII